MFILGDVVIHPDFPDRPMTVIKVTTTSEVVGKFKTQVVKLKTAWRKGDEEHTGWFYANECQFAAAKLALGQDWVTDVTSSDAPELPVLGAGCHDPNDTSPDEPRVDCFTPTEED